MGMKSPCSPTVTKPSLRLNVCGFSVGREVSGVISYEMNTEADQSPNAETYGG